MIQSRKQLITNCEMLINAYKGGQLGSCELPEDESPVFAANELEVKLSYFTFPMALNYRRNSTQLWKAALATYEDPATRNIFSVPTSAGLSLDELRERLLTYKVAMQPNRHTLSWSTIARTIDGNWGSLEGLLDASGYDFLALKDTIRHTHRKGFPCLAGPKLFNYWCFILDTKCGIQLANKEFIDIAVDSHVLRCSVKLGVVSIEEASVLSTEEIAQRWREQLEGSSIAPSDLNVPLWFWSRNGFVLKI